MRTIQSRLFETKVKKMSKAQKIELDTQIKLIYEDPTVEVEKKGDLRGLFVHKFKIKTLQHLTAYRFTEECLELIMIGTHQN